MPAVPSVGILKPIIFYSQTINEKKIKFFNERKIPLFGASGLNKISIRDVYNGKTRPEGFGSLILL